MNNKELIKSANDFLSSDGVKVVKLGEHYYEKTVLNEAFQEIIKKSTIVSIGLDEFSKSEKLLFDIIIGLVDND